MSLTINHQTNDISNSTGAITINGVAVGGDNTPKWYGARYVHAGGASTVNVMDYVTIQTTGNATDFGDLTVGRYLGGGTSNGSRGVFGGGYTGSNQDVIDYITIGTTGNAADFGNMTVARRNISSLSNGTRGVFAGGFSSGSSNIMDYITISTTGNATDFGDLTQNNSDGGGGVCDGTIGVFHTAAGDDLYRTEKIIVATAGNATDYGALSYYFTDATSNISDTTYGVFCAGLNQGSESRIERITIATNGNGTDIGDLNTHNGALGGGGGDASRGIVAGGDASASGPSNVIQYLTIAASSGNAVDFGDLTRGVYRAAGGAAGT